MNFPRPLYSTQRDRSRPTYGPAVGKVARALGMPLMPWQQHVANVGLEMLPNGRPAYKLVVVTVQRQSGKTTLMRPLAMHRMITTADASCWLTAQKRNDARDIWANSARAVERSPLARAVKTRRANGSESIMFAPTGGELRVFAPSEDALHGKTTHLVMVDEVWAFEQEQGDALLQALVPTQITVPSAQMWLYSTAGTTASTWLRGYVDEAREAFEGGGAPPFAYFEWGLPADADLSDLDAYAAAHPAYGHTIDREGLESARDIMKNPALFARAYGNRWTDAEEFLIDPAVWERARTAEPVMRAPVAFAAEVTLDRSRAYVVAAGYTAPGIAAFEIIDERPGTAWLAPRLAELAERDPLAIVLDPYGPARGTLATLQRMTRRKRPMPLLEVSTSDYVAAFAALLDGLEDGSVRHRDHEQMDRACFAAVGRIVREQTVIARENAAPLVAGMLAVYGLRNAPVPGARPVVANANGA